MKAKSYAQIKKKCIETVSKSEAIQASTCNPIQHLQINKRSNILNFWEEGHGR